MKTPSGNYYREVARGTNERGANVAAATSREFASGQKQSRRFSGLPLIGILAVIYFIAGKLGSLGWVSAIDSEERTIWIVDAHRGDGKGFSEQQCSPVEPREIALQIPKIVQERGQSTLQPKMRSRTIANRFDAMLLDRPDGSIFS